MFELSGWTPKAAGPRTEEQVAIATQRAAEAAEAARLYRERMEEISREALVKMLAEATDEDRVYSAVVPARPVPRFLAA